MQQCKVIVAILAIKPLFVSDDSRFQDSFGNLTLGAFCSWHFKNFISIANVCANIFDSQSLVLHLQYIVKSTLIIYFESVFDGFQETVYLNVNQKLLVLYEKNE